MVIDLAPTLARIGQWLAANRPDYWSCLQPGATPDLFATFEARFELQLPPDFKQLYGWRNGQDPNAFDAIHFNRMFVSLDAVAESKDILDGMIGSDFEDPSLWRRTWLPFLSNGGGSHLCYDLAAEGGGSPGQLVAFWKADDDRPIEYASLATWLSELLTSMENGTLEVS
jgi:cell wall assembly regulator SMI1